MPLSHVGRWDPVASTNAGFVRTLTWTYNDPSRLPVDLTGYTGVLTARKPDGSVALRFSTSPGAGEGTMTLGGSAGTITLSISAALMASKTPGEWAFDLLVTPSGGDPFRLLKGTFTVEQGTS